MGHQAIVAKICVFVLLGINVAAYFYFWPRQSADNAAAQSEPHVPEDNDPLLPAPVPKELHPARAKKLPAGVIKAASPVHTAAPTDELIQRLLDHMKQEGKNDPAPQPDQAAPAVKPRNLSPLRAEPLQGDPAKIGVTSPLTVRALPSPWTFHREAVGQQTVLIAELKGAPRGLAEFRILCDRVEADAGKNVCAIGNVAITGANLRGDCQRLTVLFLEAKIALEGDVHLIQEPALGTLTGARVIWEAPAAFPDSERLRVPPAVLGAPK